MNELKGFDTYLAFKEYVSKYDNSYKSYKTPNFHHRLFHSLFLKKKSKTVRARERAFMNKC